MWNCFTNVQKLFLMMFWDKSYMVLQQHLSHLQKSFISTDETLHFFIMRNNLSFQWMKSLLLMKHSNLTQLYQKKESMKYYGILEAKLSQTTTSWIIYTHQNNWDNSFSLVARIGLMLLLFLGCLLFWNICGGSYCQRFRRHPIFLH